MKKSDLVSGKHILEATNKRRYLVAGNSLPNIDGSGWLELSDFNDDLTHSSYMRETVKYFSINKVYEIVIPMGLCDLIEKMDKACKLVWERKPELSDAERVILENVDKKYKYIARDEGGNLFIYSSSEIEKFMNEWCYWNDKGVHFSFAFFNNLFTMVKWEDEEPTLIADLLGE